MQITLEKLDIFDYAEVTDFQSPPENLIRGCIDSICDFLYWGEEAKKDTITQLEFTARAILIKYGENLEKLFGKKKFFVLD